MDRVEKPNIVARALQPESGLGRGAAVCGEVLLACAGAFALYKLRPLEKRLSKRTRIILAGGLPAPLMLAVDRITHFQKQTYRREIRQAEIQERAKPIAKAIRDAENKSEFAKNARAAAKGEAEEFAGDMQRNVVLAVPKVNPKFIIKTLADLQLINEVSCAEMAARLGFGSVVPKAEAAKVKCGETVGHFVEAFVPNSQPIMGMYNELMAVSFDNLDLFVKGFDLASLQMATVFAVVMGLRDAHFGNYLVDDKKKIWAIDFEEAMPESNDGAPRTIPVGVEMKINLFNNQPIPGSIKTVDMELQNMASIRCALAGLPQAAKPFTDGVKKHLLEELTEEKVKKYHGRVNRYSNEAVQAQLDRVRRTRKLLETRKDLSPRGLVEAFVGSHPTYKALQHLKPILRFQLIGGVPADFSGVNSKSTLQCMGFSQSFLMAKAKGEGKAEALWNCPQWMRTPILGSATILMLTVQSNNLQVVLQQNAPDLLT